jgi:hypothetical protein
MSLRTSGLKESLENPRKSSMTSTRRLSKTAGLLPAAEPVKKKQLPNLLQKPSPENLLLT